MVIVKRYLRETSFCKQKFLAGKRLSQASGFDETDLTRSEAGLLYQNDGGGQGGDGDGVDEGVGGGCWHQLVVVASTNEIGTTLREHLANGRCDVDMDNVFPNAKHPNALSP